MGGRLELEKLFHEPLYYHIKNYFDKNSKKEVTVFIFAPYIKVEILSKLLEDISKDIVVITTWKPSDILKGSSELELYPFCKENKITLYLNNKIHLKVYSNNLDSAIISSGNVSQRGLMSNGNYEIANLIEKVSIQDRLYFEKIRNESILVTDEIYEQLIDWYNNQQKEKPKDIELEEIISISKKDNFLISALPMTKNIELLVEGYENITSGKEPSPDPEISACIFHDLTNYNIESGLTKEEFLKKLEKEFFTHPFILKIDEFIRPEAFFGRIKEWIQDNCTDVPVPSRRELTENVQVLYEWFEKLGNGKYAIDVPGAHSQRITRIRH